LRVTDAGTST